MRQLRLRSLFNSACVDRTTCNKPLASWLLGITLAAVMVHQAHGAPIPVDVVINGSVSFDAVNALADGAVTQVGNFSLTQGGGATTSTYSGVTVTGGNPIAGALSDTGDGIGMLADIDAVFQSEYLLGLDGSLDITNNSATDTYKVTIKVDFSNFADADADADAGGDAFAHPEFTIFQDAITEILFSDLESDIVFGDIFNGTGLGTFGDPLSDSDTAFFDIILAPSDNVLLEAALTIGGGVFTDPGSSIADFSGAITVDGVMNLTNPVPVPGALLLFMSGLMGLVGFGRVRVKQLLAQPVHIS